MLDHCQVSRFKTWPAIRVCDLPVCAATITDTAAAMVDYCQSDDRRSAMKPLFMTSINGQVLSMCARDRGIHQLFAAADVIHCDGQPLVLLSRLMGGLALPERVATTDLFPATARLAAERGVTFYFLGATADVNRRAVALARQAHPALAIVGASDGYLSAEEEEAIVAEIARLKPDVLWVSLGAPREQEFTLRRGSQLRGVGIVKTSGGLFDFLAEKNKRAPHWMQAAGFEWLFRLALEPRRLFLRYLITNPHALYLMLKSFWPKPPGRRNA